MAKIAFIWPHGMGVTITDPDMCREAFSEQVKSTLSDRKHYHFVMPDKTVIIPKELVQTALIEISDK